MFGFLKRIIDDNARDIRKYNKVVKIVNDWEPEIKKLSDEQLVGKTAEFKQRLDNGETLDELLPEAFAVAREASWRVLGMRHFDVQILGGMVLHDGRIAEMKTGEGKTLVATAPVYLNALTGKGVHIITVNDYLATRDSEWMGQLYKFLGLDVGLSVHGLNSQQKRAAYAADITYGTNNEFGFDYLRDNMSVKKENMVQRPLYYAIVDEVDSILIDEARTPLIISGPSDKPTDMYYNAAKVMPRLKEEDDYTLDEKARAVMLTEQGVTKVENMLGVTNLYDPKNTEINHHVQQALKAKTLFKRDRDYVVKDGQVIIVDEFTGRLMFGRRYNEGLHQSIEAKEGVKIERESQTLASITFQNYFRMYEKLAGMTGTAATEEAEFQKIYGFDVVIIPTNLELARKDHSDVIFRTEQGKIDAIVEEIIEKHETGQPVLVGTVSIEKSELISNALKRKGIPHQVLNAKHHEKEADIIAQAGRFGAVTIATNMAGRGTDILLGGNAEAMARDEITVETLKLNKGKKDPKVQGEKLSKEKTKDIFDKYEKLAEGEKEKVLKAGGLHIIGTERHESRRIDNQLRGRAGRQGDPGSTRFYISLEDDLMRLFGGDNIGNIMDKVGMDDSTPINNPMISRSMESAQKKVEARNFDIRKNVLDYDDVMNQQREVIYKQRYEVLNGDVLTKQVQDMINQVIDRIVAPFAQESDHIEDWNIEKLLHEIDLPIPNHGLTKEDLIKLSKDEALAMFKEKALAIHAERREKIGEDVFPELERMLILRAVDEKWMDHLDAMDQMRQGIGLRAYGQKDPLIEYKYEAYDMFQAMVEDIQSDVVRFVQRIEVVEELEERTDIVAEHPSVGEEGSKQPTKKVQQPYRKEKQIGRNDPCPCGSGKKYKKCCGANK